MKYQPLNNKGKYHALKEDQPKESVITKTKFLLVPSDKTLVRLYKLHC